jgi:glycine dehydrogenase subunit 2
MLEIACSAKQNGSLLYYDGANLNALLGIARPGDMGFDLVHVNTHKTFSTPHGGGGPGAGPIAVKYFLKEYLPEVVVELDGTQYRPRHSAHSVGKIKSFYGHISVLLRAYAYIRTLGASGLKRASELAVLNANYIQSLLADYFPPVYQSRCMHECLLSGEKLSTTTISFAKRLIDYDIHPPTMLGAGCVYFPGNLVAAMLIEPTETESKKTIDTMVATFKQVFEECSKYPNLVENAPHSRKVGKIINLESK